MARRPDEREATGGAVEIHHQPATRFVAEFIGKPAANTIEGSIDGEVFRAGELVVPLDGRRPAALDGGPVVLGIRPEAIEVHVEPQLGTVAMTVQVVDPVPPDTILSLICGSVTLLARVQVLPAGGARRQPRARSLSGRGADVVRGRRRQAAGLSATIRAIRCRVAAPG